MRRAAGRAGARARWDRVREERAQEPVRQDRLILTLAIEYADGDAIRFPIVASPSCENRTVLRIGSIRFSERILVSLVRGAMELASINIKRKESSTCH